MREYLEEKERIEKNRQRNVAQQAQQPVARQPVARQPVAQQVVSNQARFLVIGESQFEGFDILKKYSGQEVKIVAVPFADNLLGNPPPIVVCLFNEDTIRMLLALIRQIISWHGEFQIVVLGILWATADHANTLRYLFGEYKEEVKHIRFVLTHDGRLPSSGNLAFLSPARSLLLISHANALTHFPALMSIVGQDRDSIERMSQSEIVLPGVSVLDIWNLRHQRLPNGREW